MTKRRTPKRRSGAFLDSAGLISVNDPITEQTLIAALARDTKNKPDPSTAVEMTDDDAVVSLNWPGINAPVSVGRDGEFLLTGLVRRLVRDLVPPIHDKKRPEKPSPDKKKRPEKLRATKAQVERALIEYARDSNCSIKRAKHHVILGALADAMVYAKQQWKGRIGATRKGNEFVSGIPDDAGIIGYLKWLQQVVPELARQELLHDLIEPHVILESELESETTTGTFSWPDRSTFGNSEEESEEPSGSVIYRARLAQAVATFSELELLVFLADVPSRRFAFAEELCELATRKLSAKQRLILNTDYPSDQAISVATGIPKDQVPQYAKLAAKKFTGGTLTRKAWKKFLRV